MDIPSASRLTRRTVLPSEIDQLGHVNNTVYVAWIQDAAIEHWNAAASASLKSQFVWMCSRHEIDYRDQFFEGEAVHIRTWLGTAKGARFDRYVDIRKEGGAKSAVFAKTTWVLIDSQTRRPTRIPKTILDSFEQNIAG